MTTNLVCLCIDANDPERLAAFWGGLLDRPVQPTDDGPQLVPTDGTEFPVYFLASDEPKLGPNQMHFDLTSTSLDDQRATVARALELGGAPLDIGQGADATHVVLVDPEGNEFCVIAPDNDFLAGTARIGALSSDGSQPVGYFWSEALGWPLVWDLDEETAIQSPAGGTKISWGGPPVNDKLGKNRLHLDIAPPADGDQEAEVTRLLGLGATHADIGQGDVHWTVMADPDGNEFCVLPPR
jgi:predicted enzyme related to lactoylglutathione lyase